MAFRLLSSRLFIRRMAANIRRDTVTGRSPYPGSEMAQAMYSASTATKSSWYAHVVAVAILAGFLVYSGPARADGEINYSVSVVGVADSDLRQSILDASQLVEKSRRPVSTKRALRRRVGESQARITALLRARAYYAAQQNVRIDQLSETSAAITLEIDLGPVYRIGTYDIQPAVPGDRRQGIPIPLKSLGFQLGDAARSEIIAAADGRLLAALGRKGYPLARIGDRRVVVDHKAHTLSVEIALTTGPYAFFGATRIEGLEWVEPALVQRHLDWVRGEPFNSDALETTRKTLRQTGLFSGVTVQHAEEANARDELDLIVSLTERKHRSIGVGGAFSTTEGLLAKIFWEHRNLRGQGERLRVRGELGQIRQGIFGDFRVPDFGSLDQDLVFDARATNEQPDGYTSLETAAIVRLERRLSNIFTASAGVGYDRSDVEENNSREIFTFLTLPMSIRRDTSDDLLDPGSGGRDALTFTPNIGIVGTAANFVAARLFDTVYLSLLPEKRLVLAGWTRIGAVVGEETQNIPANKRLYAGGAGSVRGYALNTIGPLDRQNDAVGGRSSTEFGVELRWRISDPFGLVAFAEAGGIYDDAIPKWGKDLQWGAGFGVRYLTRIGPLRLDFAVPVNRRDVVDNSFQILVSLGQAF